MVEFFSWLNCLFAHRDTHPIDSCPHEKVSGPFTITVGGENFTRTSRDRCPACEQTFAEQYATTCAACRKPIIPDTLVGTSGQPDCPFVHNDGCLTNPMDYCGMWGAGKLLTLHDLNPKFPPGSYSIGQRPPDSVGHTERHHH